MSSSRKRCAPTSSSSGNVFDRLMRKEQRSTTKKVRQREKANGPNAFDLLMGGNRVLSPEKTDGISSNSPNSEAISSRFVLCPMGCGTHISELTINAHIDSCTGTDARIVKKERNSEDVHTCSEKLSSPNVDSGKTKESDKPNSGPSVPTTDAFAHMMDQSERVFSAKPLKQRFHVGEDGSIAWLDSSLSGSTYSVECNPPNTPKQNEIIRWSASVTLKGARMLECGEPDSLPPQDLELTISSAFPSAVDPLATNRRLVRKHSRFSVPVLKSILQKCIRRRRPLPSVRVAMELIDKSLSDFLRRMPIIILEDSTLHPDFPLLVWLMIADSKGFVIPPQLMTRVLQIVYEIASCPYADLVESERAVPKDPEQSNTNNENGNVWQTLSEHLCLSSPVSRYEKEFGCMSNICTMMIRTMLIRAQYGGMACDIKMIDRYVYTWRKRFLLCDLPDSVAETLSLDGRGKLLNWWHVPEQIHCSAKIQSVRHIANLDTIEKLTMKDLSIAGIDFHCSSVLESIIHDAKLFSSCCDHLARIPDVAGPKNNDRQSWVLGILKTCMWNFSSGVNHRRPLLPSVGKSDEASPTGKEDALKRFWVDVVSASATKYMKAYAEERVVH